MHPRRRVTLTLLVVLFTAFANPLTAQFTSTTNADSALDGDIGRTVTANHRDALPLRHASEDQPFVGNELPVATQPPLALNHVRTTAAAFVAERAISGIQPEWIGAAVGEAVPFYSTSAPYPLAYEFAILKDGAAQGSVLCGATEGTPAVISYSYEGNTVASALRENVKAELGYPIQTEARYLYGGASQYGIEVRPLDSRTLPPANATLTAIPEEGTILYSSTFLAISRYDWNNRFKADFRVSREWIAQQRAHRYDLSVAATLRRQKVHTNASKPKITTGILRNSKLADFYQTKSRMWSDSNRKCYTGCTPLAAAIVFEYWDRDGYANSIGWDGKNRKHTDMNDDDVIAALKALRRAMGTFCDDKGSGATPPDTIDEGVEAYARSRGYKRWSARNDKTSLWYAVRNEIDEGRPSLLTYGLPQPDGTQATHTAVPYSYVNSTNDNDDSICVRTGDQNNLRQCYMVNSSTEPWYIVTRITPKK